MLQVIKLTSEVVALLSTAICISEVKLQGQLRVTHLVILVINSVKGCFLAVVTIHTLDMLLSWLDSCSAVAYCVMIIPCDQSASHMGLSPHNMQQLCELQAAAAAGANMKRSADDQN